MTLIERTAYPSFEQKTSASDLARLYSPTLREMDVARAATRGNEGRTLAYLVMLKSFQRLGYFPRREEVPDLATEREAREFWDTHEVIEEYLESADPVSEEDMPQVRPSTPRTKPIAVRFDEDVLERLKQLADHKHKGYQTLLKEFVPGRLYEEEKREGIIK